MKIVTSQMMREIDRIAIEDFEIPSIVLMENAALKVIKHLEMSKDNFTVICGIGNNGGDGLAVARHLLVLGKNVEAFIVGKIDRMSKDCQKNYNILKRLDVNIKNIRELSDLDNFRNSIYKSDVIIDAIFGTGISRNVEGIEKRVIDTINDFNKHVISVDIPSGLNGDNGYTCGVCVKASETISFEFYKKGFLSQNAQSVIGELVVEKIGIPNFVSDRVSCNEFMIEESDVKEKIPKRNIYSNKGDFGRVTIFAGSKGFTGAAYITTQAAVRAGGGLVTLCCNENIQDILSNKLVEAMTVSYEEEDRLNDILSKSNVIAMGPGLGNNENTLNTLKDILEKSQCPIVLDADAINVLQYNMDLLKGAKQKIILTPHPGEMSRITGMTIENILKDRIKAAKELAKEYGVIVLLKGYNTIITDGYKTVVNSTGNSAMASGGMGDCLTGIIASFIGQGIDLFEATWLGAYIHGYCGDILGEDMFCVNANHVLEKLPYAIKELKNMS